MLFVTGAGGWVGNAVLTTARSAGLEAVPLRRQEMPVGDGGPAVVIHCAWPAASHSGADESEDSEWAEFEAWSLALREYCTRRSTRLMGIGTGLETLDDHALAAGSAYAQYRGRKLRLKQLLAGDGGTTWIRLHFLFGPAEPPNRLLPQAIRAARSGQPITTGRLDRKRRWMDLRDCADELIKAARRGEEGELDLCGCEDISFGTLLDLAGRAVGRPVPVVEVKSFGADAGVDFVRPLRPLEMSHSFGTSEQLLQRMGSLVK